MSAETNSSNNVTDDTNRIPIDDDGQVTLPVIEVLTGRGFLTGKTGSGKSNSASVVAEELLDRNLPLLIVDTDGEYWGLKEQYEILHVGADEECDLQVGPEHAEKLAELALEQNVPIILDVSGYLEEENAKDLIRQTTRHLFAKEKTLKKPFLLVVEEIHEYLPEGPALDDTGQMLIRVAKRGRKRGLGMLGISQRPADVKKDYITQCDWLVWHRLTWENDTKVVRRVVDKEAADGVQTLGEGEALLQADWSDANVQRVQWRRKKTFDAGATPDLDDFERPDLKSVSGDLVGELEEISEREERRQDRIAQLEERLDEKDDRIEELEEELERARDMQDMAQQFTQAMTASGGENGEAIQQKVDEIREEKNARIRELDSELDEREARIEELQQELDERPELPEGLDIEEAEEAVTRLREALGIEVDGEAEKWKRKYQQEREKREQAEEKANSVGESMVSEEFTSAIDFLKHDAVQAQVQKAAEQTTISEDHFWDALFAMSDNAVDTVHPEDLTSVVDIHKENISKVLRRLSEKNIVSDQQDGRKTVYSLNVEGLSSIVEAYQKRQEIQKHREDVSSQ